TLDILLLHTFCTPLCFFLCSPPTTHTYTLSLHDALPISRIRAVLPVAKQNAISAGTSPSEDSSDTMRRMPSGCTPEPAGASVPRSEEHTSELQSRFDLVCRLLLEKKKQKAEIYDAVRVTA